MRSEKNKIKDTMTEIINSIEVSEGVQIAVNSKFFNHFVIISRSGKQRIA